MMRASGSARRSGNRTATALLAGGLALAACAGPDPAPPRASYDADYARDMVTAGFGHIRDRYIEEVALREVTLAALNGLRTLDDSLAVHVAAGDVVLHRAGAAVSGVPAPDDADDDAWAGVTVAMIETARAVSPQVGDADAEALFEAVFDGATTPLDGFSRYASAAEARDSTARREGYGGIGLTVRLTGGTARVVSVMDDTPAAAAGLLAGDEIRGVDGVAVAGWTQRQLVDALRGAPGTGVSLDIRRGPGGRALRLSVTRDRIIPQTVAAEWRDGVAVISISAFSKGTGADVAAAMRRLGRDRRGGIDGVVLDLRGNPGGLLDQAVEVADVFLDSGDVVVTRGRHPGSRQRHAAGRGDLSGGAPVVVLVNGESASSSEVVAAALQDSGRAVVVGTNSYGKGTVQTVERLPNGGELTLTWSRLLAPSGYRLHGLGVLPTLCTGGGSAARLLPRLRRGDIDGHRLHAAWRRTGAGAVAARDALRAACSAAGGTPDGDLRIARELIGDGQLYGLALRAAGRSLAEGAARP